MMYIERVASGLVFKKINLRPVKAVILRNISRKEREEQQHVYEQKQKETQSSVPKEIGDIKKIQIASAIERYQKVSP